jgi:hypothetical protein
VNDVAEKEGLEMIAESGKKMYLRKIIGFSSAELLSWVDT